MSDIPNQILFKYLQNQLDYNVEQDIQEFNIPKMIELDQKQRIYELIIQDQPDFQLTPTVSCTLEKLKNLIYLGLNGCKISKLINFPLIDTLLRITLDDNLIENNELKFLEYYSNKSLVSLSIAQNQLEISTNSTAISFIMKMQNLKQLSIMGNTFNNTTEEDENTYTQFQIEYFKIRDFIFKQLPNLIYLDNIKRDQDYYNIRIQNQVQEEHYLATFLLDGKQNNNDEENSNEEQNSNEGQNSNEEQNNNDNEEDSNDDEENSNDEEQSNEDSKISQKSEDEAQTIWRKESGREENSQANGEPEIKQRQRTRKNKKSKNE